MKQRTLGRPAKKISPTDFFNAVKKGKLEFVKRALEDKEFLVNETFQVHLVKGKVTALYIACKNRNRELVSEILKHPGIDPNKGMVGKKECSPLEKCAKKGYFDIVLLLLLNKKTVNVLNKMKEKEQKSKKKENQLVLSQGVEFLLKEHSKNYYQFKKTYGDFAMSPIELEKPVWKLISEKNVETLKIYFNDGGNTIKEQHKEIKKLKKDIKILKEDVFQNKEQNKILKIAIGKGKAQEKISKMIERNEIVAEKSGKLSKKITELNAKIVDLKEELEEKKRKK